MTGISSPAAYVLTTLRPHAVRAEINRFGSEEIGMERQLRTTRARTLALPVLAILAASSAHPARAQTYDPKYPVCLQIYQGGATDYYFECAYTSMPQCQASASGRAAQCVVNPFYGKNAPVKKRVRAY